MTTATELVTAWFTSSPFNQQLALELKSVDDGASVVRMPFDASRCTMGDVVHGGAVSTLIDCAATVAAWAGADVPEQMRGSTIALSVTFLAAARGDLFGNGRLVRRGKNLAFCDVEVTNASGEVVAKGLVTYKIG